MDNSHIVLSYQPFDFTQSILVYTNGTCIEIKHCKYEEIPETIIELSKKHNIKRVDIRGNREFVEKIKDNLFMPRYGKNQLDVNLHY